MKTGRRVVTAFSVCVLALAALPAAQAQIYRWVDSSGTVHYGNNPPAGVHYQTIHPHTTPPARPAKSSPQPAPVHKKVARGSGQSAGRAREKRLAARVRRKNCKQARANLKWLKSFRARRALVKGKHGSVHRLTENQRQARIKLAKARIARTCSSD